MSRNSRVKAVTFVDAALPAVASRPFALRVMSLRNVLTTIFLILCGIMTFNHPLWRDEAQAFLIGRDSHSIGELLYNLRYEGHPPLWHFLIFLLTRITAQPEAMQAMHLAMAAGSVYLVARFSPFPWPIKCIFAFGYFPLFEYGMLAQLSTAAPAHARTLRAVAASAVLISLDRDIARASLLDPRVR